MSRARRFGEFRKAVAQLARVPSSVSTAFARDVRGFVRHQQRAQVDPYEKPFAPLTAGSIRRGRRPPMLLAVFRRVGVQPLPKAGVRIAFGHEATGFHQTGTKWMARRALFPYAGIPRKWSAKLQQRLTEAVRERLK